MKRVIGDTIAARVLLVLVLGLAVSHLLSIAFYFTDRSSVVSQASGEQLGERIITIIRLVEDASPQQRPHIVELVENADLRVVWGAEDLLMEHHGAAGTHVEHMEHMANAAVTARLKSEGREALGHLHSGEAIPSAWRKHLDRDAGQGALGEAVLVSVPLRDGSWLNFAAPTRALDPIWSLRFALSTGVMLLAVVILSAFVVRYVTGPLRTFAQAARRVGTDVKAAPIPESGPAEVREATRAFNEMHDRIRHFVEDRTQMIAAISHDLGTPVTRLRLRAEFVEDEEQRRKMLADLDDIEKMVGSALSFARDDAAVEVRATVDLKSVIQRVCDDAADAGGDVAASMGEAVVPYACRPGALRRALTNLVENAVKYGKRARVGLEDRGDAVVVTVEDDGPGIPDELREEAFRPFRRLETSRSRETGGTGLGLTVARTIVLGHGGRIELANRPAGGLRVDVHLPR